jgi:4-amino-4-deoxy-L-arabinose transferase-like glycosyltransferase
MVGIRGLQWLAEVVPPDVCQALILLAAALAAVVSGWRRDRSRLAGRAPGLAYLILASLLLVLAPRLLLPWPLIVAVTAAALAALIIHVIRDDAASPEPASTIRTAGHAGYIAAGAGFAALLLLADLSGYSGSLLVWEFDTSGGLDAALRAGESVWSYGEKQLLWDSGLVSSGHHSLLFGTATYALWHAAGVSILTLRAAAVLLALASLPIVWFAGRLAGGRTAAASAVVLLAVNPVLIFYGRYGTSLSGSILAVLLAFCACCIVADPDRARWWAGLLAGGALFLATLGYSTGRLAAIGMLGATLMLVGAGWRRLDRRRLVSVGLLVAVVAGVWLLQLRHGTTKLFVSARGEQVVAALTYPDGIRAYLGRAVSPEQLTWTDRTAIVRAILDTTVPEFRDVVGLPFTRRATPRTILEGDPPRLPLHQAAPTVFALWGLAAALRRIRRPPYLLLVVTLLSTTVPILFTTRVDSHRLMMATIPIVVLSAVGVRDAVRVARGCVLPPKLLHAFGIGLMVMAAADTGRLLYYDPSPSRPLVDAIEDHIASVPRDRVQLVTDLNVRDLGRVRLRLIERRRTGSSRDDWIMPPDPAASLADGGHASPEDHAELAAAVARGPVVIAPASRYRLTAGFLRDQGMRVEEHDTPDGGYLLVSTP